MAQNSSQKLKVPAVPKIANSERMTKHVRVKSKTKLLPEFVKFTKQVPLGELCVVLSMENATLDNYRGMTPKQLSEFEAKGYKAEFVALPFYFQGQVIEVNVFSRKRKRLVKPQTRVKKKAGKNMHGSSPILDELEAIVRGKRR